MALGDLMPVIATLGHWQRVDLAHALSEAARASDGATGAVPLNLVPHIRAAVADRIDNPTDRIAMDVIALLFDYVFRDPSIADSQRRIFGRLQVPIVKAALLEREFFSDRNHPARRLLDLLAEAAVGATGEDAYRDAFDGVATRVVDAVCRDFETDLAVFNKAIDEIQAFVDNERRESAPALRVDVAAALADEAHEADRAQVRALLRDRLAGIDLPFEVRSFAETVWADYLTARAQAPGRRRRGMVRGAADAGRPPVEHPRQGAHGAEGPPHQDDPVARQRSAQGLRDARAARGPFARLLRDAVRPPHGGDQARTRAAPGRRATHPGCRRRRVGDPTLTATAAPLPPSNVHDFVDEMVVGTWLSFDADGVASTARLSWVSPLRSKYIFTSRSHVRAIVLTPEELAWKLVNGKASLVVEPVPLFDRAVSAALDTLAARKSPAGKSAGSQAGA